MTNLIIETTKLDELLRKIEELESDHKRLIELINDETDYQQLDKSIKNITKKIELVLKDISNLIKIRLNRLQKHYHNTLMEIVMNESTNNATITYKLSVKNRYKLASPRGVYIKNTNYI